MIQDQVIYAFGSGRDPQTKMARRLDRFGERTFRIGADVVVRAGRRIPISVKYIADHLEEVIGHVERGALRLQSDSDRYLDPNELRALVRGEPLVKASEEYRPEPEPETEVLPQAEPEVMEPLVETPAVEDDAPEPTSSPLEEPEQVEAEMAAPAYEPLPDGWRTQSKRVLLTLGLERGLNVNDKMSNRELTAVLSSFESSQGA
jgi:hypothetical protein